MNQNGDTQPYTRPSPALARSSINCLTLSLSARQRSLSVGCPELLTSANGQGWTGRECSVADGRTWENSWHSTYCELVHLLSRQDFFGRLNRFLASVLLVQLTEYLIFDSLFPASSSKWVSYFPRQPFPIQSYLSHLLATPPHSPHLLNRPRCLPRPHCLILAEDELTYMASLAREVRVPPPGYVPSKEEPPLCSQEELQLEKEHIRKIISAFLNYKWVCLWARGSLVAIGITCLQGLWPWTS